MTGIRLYLNGMLPLKTEQINHQNSSAALSLYYNLNSTDMRKQSHELPLLLELEHDQHDIAKIKEQRHLISKIQSTIAKKDQEIEALKTLVEKYQVYQQKYSSLKLELSQKMQIITRKDGEFKLLKRQFEQMMRDYEQMSQKMKQGENEKQQLIRQRQIIERTNKQSQKIFKEYQSQCRKREQQLSQQLQRAYYKHKQQNNRIDDLEMQVQTIPSLKNKILQLEKEIEQSARVCSKEKTPIRIELTENQDLTAEVMRLQEQLLKKEEELTSQRMLNYELTIEYDQTVSALCCLESEVSSYRRENTEMKQSLNVRRQQQNTLRIQQKYGGRHRMTNVKSKSSSQQKSSEQQSQQQETGYKFQNQQQFVSTES